MSNKAFDLPVPAAGAGASVDVHELGKEKTIDVTGPAGLICHIEASIDNSVWCQVETFQGPGKRILDIAARFMRVRVAGAPAPTNVDVASNTDGTRVATFVIVPNGTSAAVNVSALGMFNTLIADVQQGKLVLQISQDNIDWEDCISLVDPENCISKSFTAIWARVVDSGSGASAADLCAVNDPVTVDSQANCCIVYRPGGVSEGNVYATFDEIEEALANAEAPGCMQVAVDDSIVTPAPIPTRATRYDMRGAELTNYIKPTDPSAGVNVQIQDGAGFVTGSLTKIGGELTIFDLNTVASAIILGEGAFFEFGLGDSGDFPRIITQGSVPFWDATGVTTTALIRFGGCGVINGGTQPIGMGDAGTLGLTFAENTDFRDDAVVGPAGSVLSYGVFSSGARWGQQPNYLGTQTWYGLGGGPSVVTRGRSSLVPEPGPVSVPSIIPIAVPYPSSWVRVNNDAGGFSSVYGGGSPQFLAQNLFPNDMTVGQSVKYTEFGGINAVLIKAQAGESLNGVVDGEILLPAGGSLTFMSDGFGNWQYYASDAHALPTTWVQTDIADGQEGVALATLNAAFDEITAVRPGSVVGMAAQLTTNKTAGVLALSVTIGGVAGTLGITFPDADDHAEARQAVGIDTFAAGDKIGVEILTDASFEPNTADIQVWLLIAPF